MFMFTLEWEAVPETLLALLLGIIFIIRLTSKLLELNRVRLGSMADLGTAQPGCMGGVTTHLSVTFHPFHAFLLPLA